MAVVSVDGCVAGVAVALIMAAVAVVRVAEAQQQAGFVGLRGGNLVVDPPEGGRVLLHGVDYRPLHDNFEGYSITNRNDAFALQADAFMAKLQIDKLSGRNEQGAAIGDASLLHDEVLSHRFTHTQDMELLRQMAVAGNILNHVSRLQSIAAADIRDVCAFEIGKTLFVAVAAFQDQDVTSPVYRWDPATNTLLQHQIIETSSPTDIEHVLISGEHFLAVGSWVGNSVMYRWQPLSQQFVFHKSIISAFRVASLQHFVVGGDDFLAIANEFTVQDQPLTTSVVLKWDSALSEFGSFYNQIATTAARRLLHCHIGNDDFLLVINRQGMAQWYRNDNNSFTEKQDILSMGNALDAEHFVVDGDDFFVVTFPASVQDGISKIFRYDPSRQNFDTYQVLDDVPLPVSWTHFQEGNDHYLISANAEGGDNSPIGVVALLRWHPVLRTFALLDQREETTIRHWEHFQIDGNHYLAGAVGVETDTLLLAYEWNRPALGSFARPASSCAQLKARESPSGVYSIRREDVTYVTYCDLEDRDDGGGWELLMKINGTSKRAQYTSDYWTSDTVVEDEHPGPDFGVDGKYWGFNLGHFRELRADWRFFNGTEFRWAWSTPEGWSNVTTPQQYFNTERVIATDQVTDTMEWKNGQPMFSSQACGELLAINKCTRSKQGSDVTCARWGMLWNNECHLNSSDVANGIGLRPIHFWDDSVGSAGNLVSCCEQDIGVKAPFDVVLWARD